MSNFKTNCFGQIPPTIWKFPQWQGVQKFFKEMLQIQKISFEQVVDVHLETKFGKQMSPQIFKLFRGMFRFCRSSQLRKSGPGVDVDPLVVPKPVEGSTTRKSDKMANPRSEVLNPCEPPLPSNSVGKCSSSEDTQDLLVPSHSDLESDIPPRFTFGAVSNLSQKLLAGGQALLNVKDEAVEQKSMDSSVQLSLPSTRDEKTLKSIFAVASSPAVRKDFLSTVLSSSPSPLPSQVGSRSLRGMPNSRSRFERFCVEDLCTRGKTKDLSSFTKTVKIEVERPEDVPLDYSMKTLCRFEASSMRCKVEQPLDLSMKKFDKSYSQNSHAKSCRSESQTPLDLSKSSPHRKVRSRLIDICSSYLCNYKYKWHFRTTGSMRHSR